MLPWKGALERGATFHNDHSRRSHGAGWLVHQMCDGCHVPGPGIAETKYCDGSLRAYEYLCHSAIVYPVSDLVHE